MKNSEGGCSVGGDQRGAWGREGREQGLIGGTGGFGERDVLFVDFGDGFMGIYLCQNISNCTFKCVPFIIFQF